MTFRRVDEPYSKRRIVHVMFAMLIAVVIVTFLLVGIAGDRDSFSQSANAACRTHDGVRQIPDERTVAVCNDGTVVEVDH